MKTVRDLILIVFLLAVFPPLGAAILLVWAITKMSQRVEPLGLRGRREARAWARGPL